MPTYEYECERSGNRFEAFQPISARPLKTCPACGGPARRLISAGAAVLVKGPRPAGPSCDRARPCCGRDEPCDTRPCEG